MQYFFSYFLYHIFHLRHYFPQGKIYLIQICIFFLFLTSYVVVCLANFKIPFPFFLSFFIYLFLSVLPRAWLAVRLTAPLLRIFTFFLLYLSIAIRKITTNYKYLNMQLANINKRFRKVISKQFLKRKQQRSRSTYLQHSQNSPTKYSRKRILHISQGFAKDVPMYSFLVTVCARARVYPGVFMRICSYRDFALVPVCFVGMCNYNEEDLQRREGSQ